MITRNPILFGLLCGLLALPILATNRAVDVAVSPSVLVTKNKRQPWVTIHANVPIAEVDPDTAQLIILAEDQSELTFAPVKLLADECGDLVAKFDGRQICDVLKAPQRATFVFAVLRLDGTVMTGSAVVRVK